MPRKPKIRLGNALLCEYAARGNRNKYTLVNVYSGNVVFDVLPAPFGFGLFIEIMGEQGPNKLGHVTVSIRLNGDEMLSVGAEQPEGQGALVLTQIQSQVTENSTLEVVLSAEGFADTVALTKRFYLRPTE
jgi:hypothetical protein